jgi:hypothetical protein
MDPAENHKQVIEACLRRVRKDCPKAYAAMTEKDSLKKGIHTALDLNEMGDYAGNSQNCVATYFFQLTFNVQDSWPWTLQ